MSTHPLPRLGWTITLLGLLFFGCYQKIVDTAPAKAQTVPPVNTPALFFTEVMADPAAVGDSQGEWVEFYNPGPDPVDLLGWVLTDEASDRYVIERSVVIGVGQFLVLARNGDPAQNGGVQAADVYRGVTLANGDDQLILLRPDGAEQDRIRWGSGSGLAVVPGASFERIGFSMQAPWQVALAPWPGSSGDLGSPGTAYTQPPAATPTPSPSLTPPPAPTATSTAQPTVTWTPTPLPTESAARLTLRLSEFMANPSAVNDSDGEWIEVANTGTEAINLADWRLSDGNRDEHVISADLWVPPQGFAVLARNGDPALNGGVSAQYVYSGITLGNGEDALWLFSPSGLLVDRVDYPGPLDLRIPTGASLERTVLSSDASWTPATQPWPGSAGDLGSPGAGFTLPPTPTATPVPTRPAAFWLPVVTPAPLQINQVHFLGSDGEFVTLINRGTAPLSLAGWAVGDAEVPGASEGVYALPESVLLAPEQIFVIARDGEAFQRLWGQPPHAQFEASSVAVPVLSRRSDLASGRLALNDSGDELVLLDPSGNLADAVAFGRGNATVLGLPTALSPYSSFSLQRVPTVGIPTVGDLRHRFLWAPPDPWMARQVPTSQPPSPGELGRGMLGVTGTLGAFSLFSIGGTAPPQWVQAQAQAVGLDFLALADSLLANSTGAQMGESQAGLVTLPAYRWQGVDGGEAILYGDVVNGPGQLPTNTAQLLETLIQTASVAQWIGATPVPGEAIVAAPGDGLTDPADFAARLFDWQEADWQEAGALPLLVGNSLPPLPSGVNPAPSYTGLAVNQLSQDGLLDAIRAGRGWVTSEPGLRLGLVTADGQWMGQEIQPAASLQLELIYQDGPDVGNGSVENSGGEVAGLTVWQDGRPVAQADLPQRDGVWRVSVPAFPGGLIYAAATQADGDFAVTAPLRVAQLPGGRVVINEILPVPISDHNGDGEANTQDEYIELFNPEAVPISLAGWQLVDQSLLDLLPDLEESSERRTFTFGRSAFIGPGKHLLIWAGESRIGLNNRNEQLTLYNATGAVVDRLEWVDSPGGDRSYSRVPDGARWDVWGLSPGRSNGDYQPPPAVIPTPHWGSGAAPGTPGGEAVGPQGSVTDAKLRGLGEGVNFVGRVVVPPGLFNGAIYLADPAGDQTTAGLGVQVYLANSNFPDLSVGDLLMVEGTMDSFRGEREVRVASAQDLWPMGAGDPLRPLDVRLSDIGESLEGRLVQFDGVVAGWRGESILLVDPDLPEMTPIPVTVRSSLSWRRPFVQKGERWRAIGVVSQFATKPPWNGGYRVLVRFETDLTKLE